MKAPPCDPKCPGRTPGCHDHCEKYQEWKKEHEKAKAYVSKQNVNTMNEKTKRSIWKRQRYVNQIRGKQ